MCSAATSVVAEPSTVLLLEATFARLRVRTFFSAGLKSGSSTVTRGSARESLDRTKTFIKKDKTTIPSHRASRAENTTRLSRTFKTAGGISAKKKKKKKKKSIKAS